MLLELLGLLNVEVLGLVEDLILVNGWVEVKSHEGLALLAVAEYILVDYAEHLEGCQEHKRHRKYCFVGRQTELLILLKRP